MTTSEIKTFSQALPILAAHGIEPKPAGRHLWQVGSLEYDKGGIVRLAREYQARGEASVAPILSPQMRTYAQGYIDARKRAGAALLDQARFLALARDAAQYGEWGVFLEATQTSEDWAGRLLNIHDTAERDPKFAAAIRSNFLNLSTAYELSSAPADLRDRLLEAAEPPTVKAVRDEKQAAKLRDVAEFAPIPQALEARAKAVGLNVWINSLSGAGYQSGERTGATNYKTYASLADLETAIASRESPFWQSIDAHHPTAHLWTRERPDLLRSACGMTIQNRLPSGSTEGGHCSSCVRAQWPQNQATPAEPNVSEVPDLADILKRLDAHGYARTTTRTKGSTTYHSFRDYSGRSDELGGELELPEGELSYWLSDLDAKAARAQERNAQFLDARERFAALGWRFERDGVQFRLTQPNGEHYATTSQLDSHLRTLATFEAGAAKKAAAAAAPTRLMCPTCGEPILNGIWGDLKECGECYHARQRVQPTAPTLADLDATLPKQLQDAGYFWHYAKPLHFVIAHNDGWTGDARTAESALQLASDREKAKAIPFDTNKVAQLSSKLGAATDRNAALDLWIAIGPLLEPKGVQQIISSWKPDEVQAFATEADRALATLDTYGYTAIAAFLRQTYTLLLDKEPAPAADAFRPHVDTSISSNVLPSPLDPIRAELRAIEGWEAREGSSAPLDQCRGQLADLASLRKQLEQLADAPDVFDDDYEDLSGRIGELEVEIAGWIESEASV